MSVSLIQIIDQYPDGQIAVVCRFADADAMLTPVLDLLGSHAQRVSVQAVDTVPVARKQHQDMIRQSGSEAWATHRVRARYMEPLTYPVAVIVVLMDAHTPCGAIEPGVFDVLAPYAADVVIVAPEATEGTALMRRHCGATFSQRTFQIIGPVLVPAGPVGSPRFPAIIDQRNQQQQKRAPVV